MIDTRARNKLAEELRHFMECFSTNYQFDDAIFEIKTKDQGVKSIYSQVWLLYDDLQEHKLEGKWSLTEKQKPILKRCILFLKSNNEYKWQPWPIAYRVLRPFIWLITLGYLSKKLESYFDKGLNKEVWPFSTEEEYLKALENPVYMNKAHNNAFSPDTKNAPAN